jgi:hypothetical protein
MRLCQRRHRVRTLTRTSELTRAQNLDVPSKHPRIPAENFFVNRAASNAVTYRRVKQPRPPCFGAGMPEHVGQVK